MSENGPLKDLIVLVADKNIEAAFKGLLARTESLGTRKFSFDIFVHPNKDPGCRGESDQFLQNFTRQYSYALVVFDHDGCGVEENREDIEKKVEDRLDEVGWAERRMVVVLDPELEVWLWTRSPHVDEVLGWRDQQVPLRTWLVNKGFSENNSYKPKQPKEALEIALRQVKKPRSSAIYLQLAQRVSLEGHAEPAFVKLRNGLCEWFREEEV